MVFHSNRMMDLVLCRRNQDVLHHPPIADPDMAMAKVRSKRVEEKIRRIRPSDGQHAQLTDKEIQCQTLSDADEEGHQERIDHGFQRMNPLHRQRGQHVRRMVDRMERPQGLPFVMCPVRPVFTEITDNHDDNRHDRNPHPCGFRRCVIGPTELRQQPEGHCGRKENRAEDTQHRKQPGCKEQLDVQQVGSVPVHFFRQQPRCERARTAPVLPDAKGNQNRAGEVENGVPHVEIEGRIKRRCDKVLQCFHIPNSVMGQDPHKGAFGPY